jgi:hypothetical protein
MKYFLLILLVLAFVFSGCGENSTKWQDSNNFPSATIGVQVDPGDEPGDGGEVEACSTGNAQWDQFLADVEAAVGTDLSVDGEPFSCSLIACLKGDYNNHGQFVSCIAHLTNEMVKAGTITGEQKGVIQSIAGASDIGKK